MKILLATQALPRVPNTRHVNRFCYSKKLSKSENLPNHIILSYTHYCSCYRDTFIKFIWLNKATLKVETNKFNFVFKTSVKKKNGNLLHPKFNHLSGKQIFLTAISIKKMVPFFIQKLKHWSGKLISFLQPKYLVWQICNGLDNQLQLNVHLNICHILSFTFSDLIMRGLI